MGNPMAPTSVAGLLLAGGQGRRLSPDKGWCEVAGVPIISRVLGVLNEKGRRRFAGLLALQWGRGGLERLSEITGLSRPTIRRGRAEVQKVERSMERGRVRTAGAGRPLAEKNSLGC
jgi:hypothetical protein